MRCVAAAAVAGRGRGSGSYGKGRRAPRSQGNARHAPAPSRAPADRRAWLRRAVTRSRHAQVLAPPPSGEERKNNALHQWRLARLVPCALAGWYRLQGLRRGAMALPIGFRSAAMRNSLDRPPPQPNKTCPGPDCRACADGRGSVSCAWPAPLSLGACRAAERDARAHQGAQQALRFA